MQKQVQTLNATILIIIIIIIDECAGMFAFHVDNHFNLHNKNSNVFSVSNVRQFMLSLSLSLCLRIFYFNFNFKLSLFFRFPPLILMTYLIEFITNYLFIVYCSANGIYLQFESITIFTSLRIEIIQRIFNYNICRQYMKNVCNKIDQNPWFLSGWLVGWLVENNFFVSQLRVFFIIK